MRTPLEERIMTYAFVHNCDLDEAAFRVLLDVIQEITMTAQKKEGLYDRLFIKGDRPSVP